MRNKIENLISRVATLEADFATLPGGVDEQRRRRELIWCVVLPLWSSVLTSFQQTQGHRGEITVSLRGVRAAAS